MRQITMTVDEFATCKENPIQRNTIAHAELVSRSGRHLSINHPTHAKVAIAENEKGDQWILDGHSRLYLWQRGELDPPSKLFVDVYEVPNGVRGYEEVMALYQCFDSDTSVEKPRDKLWGAMKVNGFEPQRPFMFTNTGMLSGMKILAMPNKWADASRMSIYDLVKPWIPALKHIDSMDHFFNHFIFPSVVTTALLYTVNRDGADALPFWEDYHEGNGTRTKATESPAYTARQFLLAFKNEIQSDRNRGGGQHSYGTISRMAPKFIWIYDHYAKGTRVPNDARLLSKKFEKNLPTIAEYWDTQVGDRFYPEIRKQTELELELELA